MVRNSFKLTGITSDYPWTQKSSLNKHLLNVIEKRSLNLLNDKLENQDVFEDEIVVSDNEDI